LMRSSGTKIWLLMARSLYVMKRRIP